MLQIMCKSWRELVYSIAEWNLLHRPIHYCTCCK